MQPLELVKLTPRSNCGDCGHPACLAFAVAVTKAGEDPGKCPYLEGSLLGVGSLGAKFGQGGDVSQLGVEKDLALVAYLKEKIRSTDFGVLASAIDSIWTGPERDSLLFSFLGRGVELSHGGVLIDGKEVEDPREQILLYNYVSLGGGLPPREDWVGMESLPNSLSKVRTLSVYCEERIAQHFAGKVALLQEAAEGLGAVVRESHDSSCSATFMVAALPRLPLLVLMWDEEKEDGFPAKVKVLFDRQVNDFLDIESLVFVCERMAERWVGYNAI